MPNKPLFQGY